MTLTQRIEAAREAFKLALSEISMLIDSRAYPTNEILKIEKALAALPDKPMTETSVMELITETLRHERPLRYKCFEDFNFMAIQLIRALKAANVLYVEEKS